MNPLESGSPPKVDGEFVDFIDPNVNRCNRKSLGRFSSVCGGQKIHSPDPMGGGARGMGE